MTNAAHTRFESELETSVEYLDSPECELSWAVDPYWPKWNSAWWHMTLLWELQCVERIPRLAIERLLDALKNRYLHFFPFTEQEVPPGLDPLLSVMCHCGLGTAYQILRASGIDVDTELPWIRKWICQYQLPDGGWNCDEAAYTTTMRSSVVSTVPILESLLSIENRTAQENEALDVGARYLLERKLFRSLSTGKIIDEQWTQLTFPRFYEYDVLRGLMFCAKWSVQRKQPLPEQSIQETVELIKGKVATVNNRIGLPVERQFHSTCGTRIRNQAGIWEKAPSSDFPLLRFCSQVGEISPTLTYLWQNTSDMLEH